MTGVLLLTAATLGQPGGPGGYTSARLDAMGAEAARARNVCGPVCVWYCLRHFGREVPVEEVVAAADVGESGVTLQRLEELARRFGLRGKLLTTDKSNLHRLPVPAILVINENHAVVFEGLNEDGSVSVFEPYAGQRRRVSRDLVLREWTGEFLAFEDPKPSPLGFAAAALLTTAGVIGLASVARRFAAGRRSDGSAAAAVPASS